MRFLILDDDINELATITQTLKNTISNYNTDIDIDSFNTLTMDITVYDVVFLDIDMPVKDGISLAKEIAMLPNPPIIIFISHRADLVYDTFSANPFDFIRKEKFKEQIDTVVQRLINHIRKTIKKIHIKTTEGTIYINTKDIIFCESQNHMCMIHTTNNSRYKSWIKLSELKNQINSIQYIYISKSILINMDHIYKLDGSKIILMNDVILYSSRRNIKPVKEHFEKYLLGKI